MIIVAGDSNHDLKFQKRAGLDYKLTLWFEQLNLDVKNLSKCAAGNDIICNSVLKAVNENSNVDHVYVFWSEWYRVLKKPVLSYNQFVTKKYFDDGFPTEKGSQYQNWLYSISSGDLKQEFIETVNENMNRFYLLQSALKKMNIDYTFYQDLWPWPNMKYHKMFTAAKLIIEHPLHDLIDEDRFWGWPIHPHLGGKCISSLQIDQVSDTDNHYGQKTHDYLAKNIIEKGINL